MGLRPCEASTGIGCQASGSRALIRTPRTRLERCLGARLGGERALRPARAPCGDGGGLPVAGNRLHATACARLLRACLRAFRAVVTHVYD